METTCLRQNAFRALRRGRAQMRKTRADRFYEITRQSNAVLLENRTGRRITKNESSAFKENQNNGQAR